jgi:hypothetical protein
MSPGPRPPQYPLPPPPGSGPLPYAENDARAVMALLLGIASLVTCGLTGIPAVALGFSARSAIHRSGGMLRGEGMAMGGIATGLAGTALGMVAMSMVVAGILVGSHGFTARRTSPSLPAPRSTSAWSPSAPPAAPAPPVAFGSLRVLDLDPEAPRSFRQQLNDEFHRAAGAHETVVLMTNARRCTVCREFEVSLGDPRMQTALAHVSLVRVDIEDFEDELRSSGMFEETMPWFYKLDSTLRPVDAISAGEWDDNIPENMAPVLRAFLAGTLRGRREPSPVGTPL